MTNILSHKVTGSSKDLLDQKFESYARWLVTSGNTSATIPLKRKLGVL